MRDFELYKFVVCTDAGLSSDANCRFNNFGERSFITTQSIKKLKRSLKEWSLDCKGWQLEGSKKVYDISEIEDTPENRNRIFYKQMLVEGYIPNYTRTELTDALHDNAGFRTDNELTTPKAMAGIIRRSKGL